MTVLTTVHLLRHGEVHNPDGVLYGRLPGFGLSANGLAMAKTVADAIKDRPVKAIISSPLQRAQETAGPSARVFGLTPTLDERLLESENHFEGLTFGAGEGALTRPAHWPFLYNPFTPSWGEAYTAVAARMLAAAAAARDLVRAQGPGVEALCVSHQLPIWTTRRAAEGRRLWHNPARRLCGLCSLTSLRYDETDRIVSVTYSEPAGHLQHGDPTPGA